MFASIMDGMKAQRERSTTNRREAAKLFNEHLKNQSDLGIEVTEQSLSDAWDSNSGGVLRKHAPTQQRLQSIVTAQNNSLAEKKRAADFQASVDQRTLYGYVETDINKALRQNRFSTTPMNNADLYESLTGQYPEDSLQLQELESQTRNGLALGDMQTLQDNEALSEYSLELGKQIDKGFTDAKDLKAIFPSLSISQIKAYIEKYQKTEAQKDKQFKQADIIFNEGRITFNNSQIVFSRDQEAAILSAAQLVKDRAYTNTSNTMTIEAAKEAVTRLVIEQMQDDLVFGQEQYTFASGVEADVLTAVQTATERLMTNTNAVVDINQKVMNNAQTNVVDTATNKAAERAVLIQPAMDLRNAKTDINASFKTATIESVTASLERWGITDPAVITQTWNETRSQQEVFDLTGMTANNNSVDQKLQKATLANQKRVADFKKLNNQTLTANFKSVPVDYHPQINALGQHYIITSNRAQSLRVYIAGEIEKGAWDDANATQVQAALNGWAETNNIPTYSGQMAQMQLNSKNLAGVTQYTPTRFKDVYIGQFQTDAQYAIDLMESASQSNNLDGYDNAKASLATLINETQQDVLAREKDPQKAFGMRASQDEMSKVMSELKVMMKEMITSGEGVVAPEGKVDVDQGLRYDPVLFKPEFGSNTRIRSVDNAISYLENRKSGRALYVTPQQLRDLQDEYKALITSHEADKEELKNTTDTTRKIELDDIIRSNLEQLHEKHFEVGRLVRKVINEGENASSMFNNI